MVLSESELVAAVARAFDLGPVQEISRPASGSMNETYLVQRGIPYSPMHRAVKLIGPRPSTPIRWALCWRAFISRWRISGLSRPYGNNSRQLPGRQNFCVVFKRQFHRSWKRTVPPGPIWTVRPMRYATVDGAGAVGTRRLSVVAVIDWDQAESRIPAHEVVRAMDLSFDRNPTLCRAFVHGYRKIATLDPAATATISQALRDAL